MSDDGKYYSKDWQGTDPKGVNYEEQLDDSVRRAHGISGQAITFRLVSGGSEEYKKWGTAIGDGLQAAGALACEFWFKADDALKAPLGIFTRDRKLRWRATDLLRNASEMWKRALEGQITLDVRFDKWNGMSLTHTDHPDALIFLAFYNDRQGLQMFSQLLPTMERIIGLVQ